MRVASTEGPIRSQGQTIDTLLRLDPAALPGGCLPHAPTLDALASHAASVADTPVDRAEVAARLAQHNRELGNEAGALLAERLADPRAVVVMTGQQPWLYAGASMLFAKIAGAIQLARRLEDRAGVPAIPVFWNHSEDHDVDEMNRFFRFASGEVVRERLELSRHAGHAIETLALSGADAELAATWVPDEQGHLRPHSGERLAGWASRVVHEVMPDLPVVHVEPFVLCPLLGAFFGEVIRRGPDILRAVAARSRSLTDEGFELQVDPKDVTLLFELTDDGRVRVPVDGDEELASRATAMPESFSCGVLGRAAAQQHALPVVAHVNGPAENAYFAQIPDLFTALGLPVPAAWPRPMLTVVGPDEARTAERLGIDTNSLADGPSTWPEPPEPPAVAALFAEAGADLRAGVDKLRGDAADGELGEPVEAFNKRITDALARLKRTFEKHRERAGGVGRRGRRRLAETLRPRGKPQERLLGPISLFRGRDPALMSAALSGIDPLDFRHHVVTLEDEDLSL